MLGRVASFPKGVVYATVEPEAPIRWLIDAIVEVFPDTPPYGGEFAWTGPVPHCTLATCKPDQVESVRLAFTETFKATLPITIPITSIAVEEESDTGMWAVTITIPLGSRQ
jgi:hypothetical protein